MTVEPASWEIRPAGAGELAEARGLLPQAFGAGSAPDLVLVAAGKAPTRLLGAAAVAWRAWGKPPGFPILVHVAEPARRRGIGRALVAAIAEACRGETERLHGWLSVDEGSDAEAFLCAIGFSVNRRILHFEADGQTFYDMASALLERLVRRGRVPSGAELVPLADAPPARVARLVSNVFGSAYESCLANATGKGPFAWDRERSTVLLAGSEVKGVLLFQWRAGIPEIDAWVVAPDLRGGWPSIALLERTTRNGLQAGATRFRFSCERHQTHTIGLARRSAARELAPALEFSAAVAQAGRRV